MERIDELWKEVEDTKKELLKAKTGTSDYNFLALKLDIAISKIQSYSNFKGGSY